MQKIPLMAAMADRTMEGGTMNCQICKKEIKGVAPATYMLMGHEFHLTATIHDECLDEWMKQEAKRKPYRQPLEGHSPGRHFSSVPHEPEIRDWDNP
jgi:hypothetical protein